MIKISVSEGRSYTILNHRGLDFCLVLMGGTDKDLILCKVGRWYLADIKGIKAINIKDIN